MHLAKGLEFKVVVVLACDDGVLPSQGRIDTVSDEAELEEVYETEPHLLYVASARVRDRLLITGIHRARSSSTIFGDPATAHSRRIPSASRAHRRLSGLTQNALAHPARFERVTFTFGASRLHSYERLPPPMLRRYTRPQLELLTAHGQHP
ncbi:3'-5' exonuclease [Methylobacterium gnaphalii]|nr:3'-5' exonuclease [Methylobacterium gnaphalii]